MALHLLVYSPKGGMMATNGWNWANLNRQQLEMLHEGEQTLGPEILMAYQQDQSGNVDQETISQEGLQVASLDESQLECLQGLESKLQAVVVAYQSK
jgi:hypothetical protein